MDSDLTQEELEAQVEEFMRKQAEIESGSATRKAEPGKVLGADEVSEEEAKRFCREVVGVLKRLKENRDMSLNEVRLTVAIEDPRAREKRLMGMEDSSGVSREEMAAALMEVSEGRIPGDRIALRELWREINEWPAMDEPSRRRAPSAGGVGAPERADPEIAEDSFGLTPAAEDAAAAWRQQGDVRPPMGRDPTEAPKGALDRLPDWVGYGFLYFISIAPVLIALGAITAMEKSKMVEAPRMKTVGFVVLTLTYLSLNSSLNLLNKWSLGVYGFRFPFLLTSCHMLFSFCVLAPVAMRESWENHRRTLEKQWRGIVYIGAFMALNIALNNLSLLDISLTLNQIIRSAIPVVTCVLAILVESRYPSSQELAALITLTLGVMLAVWQGTATGKPYAIMFCVVGTVCNGAMMTFSGKVLSEKLDVVRLTFYTAPVSLCCLAPFYWIYERERFWVYLPSHTDGVAMIMLVSSINAVCYNMIHSLMIKKTSAVTTTVLGEVKIVGLLVLSAMLLGEGKEFTMKMTAGVVLAITGFAMYSHTRVQKLRESVQPRVMSLTASGGGSARVQAPSPSPTVLNETTNSTSLPDFWLPCGRTQLCPDAGACCAIWGVCGTSDRFCGQYCLNGACLLQPSPPPPPPSTQPGGGGGAVPSPPLPEPEPDLPPVFDPNRFIDAVVSVRENEVALAGCAEPGWLISGVENAMFGDVATMCNSSLSYSIVAAACINEPACVVPAVNPVFEDPCPRVYKTLQFGYRCQPELGTEDSPAGTAPVVLASPPPPSPEQPQNPFAVSPPAAGSAAAPPPPPAAVLAPSPPPPRRSPPPPSPLPSPSPPPPVAVQQPAAIIADNALLSPLWGEAGEMFSQRSMLSDWSQAGYAGNTAAIPQYEVKYNVRSFGAKGDGVADDSGAFIAALANASALAKASGQGVAVRVPFGKYKVTQKLVINTSRVVLRGDGPGATKLLFPLPLADVYGSGTIWAFGGTWLTILGTNSDSKDTANYVGDVTAEVVQGSKRVQVSSTKGVQVGRWLRLFVLEPNDVARRRSLLSAARGSAPSAAAAAGLARRRRQLRQAPLAPTPAPGPAAEPSLVAELFADAELQAAVSAAFAAEAKAAEAAALAEGLDEAGAGAPAPAAEGADANPAGLDPWLLAAARYAAAALLADPETERAPGTALDGTLDAYLYGENIVDSGRDGGIYPKEDHVRFISSSVSQKRQAERITSPDCTTVCRPIAPTLCGVAAVGPDWIEFERAVPYDLRLKWRPVVHFAAATVQHSGFEGFAVEFPTSPYSSHLDVRGYNAFGVYEAQNCWLRNLKVLNADNGFLVNGADFVTVSGVETDFTAARGVGAVAEMNGHHGIWVQASSNVLVTDFNIKDYRFYHDLSLAIFSESCVFSNGRGFDVNIDSHRGGTHHNLLSNIIVGLGTRTFRSGGAAYRGAHSGANLTWWNLQKADGQPIPLPPCEFGPRLFFAGQWLPPTADVGGGVDAESLDPPTAAKPRRKAAEAGAAKLAVAGPRRRLAQAAGLDLPEVLGAAGRAGAGAEDGTPGTVDATAIDAIAGAALTPAQHGGERAVALAGLPGWCQEQQWRVELIDPGYQLYPADLAGAMREARQRGGVL
ncbi:sugar phosphate phosphate translocator [Micractinium conductrix]|uniref:Sugar phosphate phosphate translocator n=1 Tax=Micractinium conductrix TaxID=554055 RepID=A0A2P6VJB1_9CHLO|nr:sugar phosphate phosphate translocator [Micractinium conductrix]|eukprot:PSC74164.1 sugar phosphate phosphate translocator [Micractinium conductrix]